MKIEFNSFQIYLLSAMLSALSAIAQTEFRYTTDNGKITINGLAGYKSSSGNITIPSTINGLPVVNIGSYAFYLSDRIINVVIPSGVTDIGANAFCSCNLAHVTLPDTLTNIGFAAFSGCHDLTDITIPKGVINIGQVALSSCINLTAINVDSANTKYSSVDGVLFNKNKTQIICCPGGKTGNFVIPGGIKEIEDNAFKDAVHLSSVTIPDSVTTIEWHSFNACFALTNISIGKNVNSIAGGEDEWIPFSECPNLASITVDALNPVYSSLDGVLFKNNKAILIKCPEGKVGNYNIPNTVTKIENHSFSRSIYLANVTIGDNVRSIENYAFENCFGLTNVSFDSKLKNIGDAGFVSCTNLTSVKIPDGVVKIGGAAFAKCANLTNAMIGKNVNSIDSGCFSDCRNLNAIMVDTKNSTYSGVDGVLLNKRESTLVKCPQNKSGTYTIPDSITTIADDSFSFSCLTNIIVTKSVKKIVNQAFLNCKATGIYFEGNAPKIVGLPHEAESLAFADCDNLTFYYRSGTRGWKSEFAGRPTEIWKP
jgi:hypothetical protein